MSTQTPNDDSKRSVTTVLPDGEPEKAWADAERARRRDMQIELRVAKTTGARELSVALVNEVEQRRRVILSCIGVQTISEAVKAVAIANQRAAARGYFMTVYPYFENTDEGGQEKTAVKLLVCRHLPGQ